jgi:hypothetical protein
VNEDSVFTIFGQSHLALECFLREAPDLARCEFVLMDGGKEILVVP